METKWVYRERFIKKKSGQKKKIVKIRKRLTKIREKAKKNAAIKRESKRKQKNFYSRASEIKKSIVFILAMIVLLYKDAFLNTNELDLTLPSFIPSLLQEYEDAFPEQTPHCLPPIWGIENQIDFVTSSTIPNRLTYKSNLEETKEL